VNHDLWQSQGMSHDNQGLRANAMSHSGWSKNLRPDNHGQIIMGKVIAL
jgi:hypothetical protein